MSLGMLILGKWYRKREPGSERSGCLFLVYSDTGSMPGTADRNSVKLVPFIPLGMFMGAPSLPSVQVVESISDIRFQSSIFELTEPSNDSQSPHYDARGSADWSYVLRCIHSQDGGDYTNRLLAPLANQGMARHRNPEALLSGATGHDIDRCRASTPRSSEGS